MTSFTVIGIYDDGEAIATGIIPGEHPVTLAQSAFSADFGRWSAIVEADDAATAETVAIELMAVEGEGEDSDD